MQGNLSAMTRHIDAMEMVVNLCEDEEMLKRLELKKVLL
jgi:hypothetical protein